MTRHLSIILISLMMALPVASVAAEADDKERIQVLEAQLKERDKVLLELLSRVEVLERRLGIKVSEAEQSVAAAPDAEVAAVAAADAEPEAGGATRPGEIIVDEALAERALERALSQDGAVLLRRGVLEVVPGLAYGYRETSAPIFVNTGGSVTLADESRRSHLLSANLDLRLGLPFETQLELGVPYRWGEVSLVPKVGGAPVIEQEDSAAGFGDLRLGIAKTLLHEGRYRPDLVARVTWDTASGATDPFGVPLGSGFNEVRGSLTAIKRQDPLVFIGGLSYQHSFERGGIEPGALYGASFGTAFALSPETSLRFFFSGGYQAETEVLGGAIPGSDRTLGTLSLSGSTLIRPGTLLTTTLGVGLTEDSDDVTLNVSVPIRWGERLF